MSKKTVYVIGAGASKEVNLPTGAQLKSRIAKLLNIRFENGFGQKSGSRNIYNALRKHITVDDHGNVNTGPYVEEAWRISEALPQAISIDNFIDNHSGNEKIELCAKLGIVESILQAERSSTLKFDPHRGQTINFASLEATWYATFFKQITENCTIEGLEDRFKGIALIIFNYDRCVEHYLFFALKNYYGVNDTQVSDLMKKITIFHPYGSIGDLPWMNTVGAVNFGADEDEVDFLKMAARIRTFTEGADPQNSQINQIRNEMSKVNRLVFLGFAYHKLNLQLITSNTPDVNETINCYASSFGISQADQDMIHEDLQEMYSGALKIHMKDLKCSDFFQEYWRSLSYT